MNKQLVIFVSMAGIIIAILIGLLVNCYSQINEYKTDLNKVADAEVTAKEIIIKQQEVIAMHDSEYLAVELGWLDEHHNTSFLHKYGCKNIEEATKLFDEDKNLKKQALTDYSKKMNSIGVRSIAPAESVQNYINYRFPEYSTTSNDMSWDELTAPNDDPGPGNYAGPN